MATSEAHKQLALQLGAEFSQTLHRELPEIAAALEGGGDSAQFTCTARFSAVKEKGQFVGWQVTLSPKVQIPRPSRSYKIDVQGGQLSLFE